MKINRAYKYDDNTVSILLEDGTVVRVRIGRHLRKSNLLNVEVIALGPDGNIQTY